MSKEIGGSFDQIGAFRQVQIAVHGTEAEAELACVPVGCIEADGGARCVMRRKLAGGGDGATRGLGESVAKEALDFLGSDTASAQEGGRGGQAENCAFDADTAGAIIKNARDFAGQTTQHMSRGCGADLA